MKVGHINVTSAKQAVDAHLTEEQVQRQIMDGLTVLGFTVLQTTVRYTKGAGFRGGYGASKGIPDLLIHHKRWTPGVLLGIEVKRPGKWKYSSPEQESVQKACGVSVATSIEEALAIIAQYESVVQ